MSSVKHENIWYTCNDKVVIEDRVKLNCLTTEKNAMIPYLLIYEKDFLSNLMTPNLSGDRNNNEPTLVEKDHDSVDFHIHKMYNSEVSQLENSKRKLEAANFDNGVTLKHQRLSKKIKSEYSI